jgi:hypothetical protein
MSDSSDILSSGCGDPTGLVGFLSILYDFLEAWRAASAYPTSWRSSVMYAVRAIITPILTSNGPFGNNLTTGRGRGETHRQ